MPTSHDLNSKPQRLPRRLLKEKRMLDQLSKRVVDLAFQHLSKPIQEAPPPSLQNLNEMEWFLLDRMLAQILAEKESQPLQ
jgi:hypothetical protein